MLSFAFLFAQTGTTLTRSMTVETILGSTNSMVIKRTLGADGNLTWATEETQDKETKWFDTHVVDSKGGLVEHQIKWQLKEPSEWRVSPSEGGIDLWTVTYRGESINGHARERMSAAEAGDPSRLWWATVKPELGAVIQARQFIPFFGLQNVKVTYEKDSQIKVGDKSYDTHVVTRVVGELRNETWYVDDKGLPVLRVFWTSSPDRPNRVDRIKD